MPTVPETPARRIRFHDVETEAPADGDFCGNEVEVGDRVALAQSFELKEDPSFWKENNVQVVIRIRPLNSSEISSQGQNMCVRQDSSQSITWTGHPESRFTFDHVASEMISQEQLFKVAGVPMVENCVAGYNSCMFAYGQTGSGKTHTMLGDIEGGTRRHSANAGMTPRVFEYMFSRIQKERETKRDDKLRFICKCSFLEIYNEQILDLLDPSSNNLQIREDARKGIYVENLKEFEVSSARDVIQQLVQGAANRKVASTNMNRASSRSHSVFTCTIESKWESQGVAHHRFARLNLVDLAGSERQKSSGAEGERLKEATNINKSLSTLGLVIMNLVSISNKKPQHVPYRDSKLTFLLQDSLGGNSKTIIIANISPSNCCALETLSTLKFAQRAKFIRNNAIINEDASGDIIALRLQIQQLKKEVNRLRGFLNGGYENQEADSMSMGIPETPGSFKWEGGHGSFSPLAFNKKLSQRKDYDALLAASIRRDQDKDKVLKALTAEKLAAEQLASQRSDEVQGLKMRLRFREERIKRLEAVSSGKLSAEAYLVNEKEELIKEMEFLQNQVDRNREATRFAMENLQLKEELRRLKAFVEEGERDMMNEQIVVLQDKLLEALDWKLMHERDADPIQGSLDFSSTNEEMEFLRLQAIQNQREVDALRKNLSSCLEAKEILERRVDDLAVQLEDQMKSGKNMNESMFMDGCSHPIASFDNGSSDQFELKAMVEAISSASQREAEAHETAITLAKENEELRVKLNVLIEDNNKLIELCDSLASEGANCKKDDVLPKQSSGVSGDVGEGHEMGPDMKQQLRELHEENEKLMGLYEEAMQERIVKIQSVQQLERQLQEIHEENEKLMGLYEEAMQERNVKIQSIQQLEHQLQEIHEENEKLMGLYEEAMRERNVKIENIQQLEHRLQEILEENEKLMGLYEQAMHERNAKVENAVQLEHQLQEVHEENEKLKGRFEQAMREQDAKTRDLEPRLQEMRQEKEKLMALFEEALRERDANSRDLKQLEPRLEEMHRENEKLVGLYEQALKERDECKRMLHRNELNNAEVAEEICCPEKLVEMDERGLCHSEKESISCEPKTVPVKLAQEQLKMVQMKLDLVQEKFHTATKAVTLFPLLERETNEFHMLIDNLQTTALVVQSKEQEIASLKISLLDMQTRRIGTDKKFEALRTFLRDSAVCGLEELKLRTQARIHASSVLVERKKEELLDTQVRKHESEAAFTKATRLEAQLKEDLHTLKLKYQEAENPKKETEKVLSEIDNLDKKDSSSHKSLRFGKASELLKSELERKNLATEIRQSCGKLGALQKEISVAKKTVEAMDAKILDLEAEVESGTILLEESKIDLENIVKKEILAMERVRNEVGELLLDFQEVVFESCLKEVEICMCTEELQLEEEELGALKASRESTFGKWVQLLKDYERTLDYSQSRSIGEAILGELEDVHRIVQEVRPLLSCSAD